MTWATSAQDWRADYGCQVTCIYEAYPESSDFVLVLD